MQMNITGCNFAFALVKHINSHGARELWINGWKWLSNPEEPFQIYCIKLHFTHANFARVWVFIIQARECGREPFKSCLQINEFDVDGKVGQIPFGQQ